MITIINIIIIVIVYHNFIVYAVKRLYTSSGNMTRRHIFYDKSSR